MNMSNFFQFKSKMSSPKYHAYLSGYEGVYIGLIPQDRLLLGDYEGFSFPLTFKNQKQYKNLDILDTGTGSFYLISTRMKNILEEGKLTGWKIFPIKLIDKKNNEIPDYHGFSILGRCGMLGHNGSQITYKQFFEGGPICKFYKGCIFDLEQWDGNDFFLPKNNLGTIITNRAANILKMNKITNLRLTNLMDVEIDERVVILRESRKQQDS